jgi:hypothetical protein
MRLDEIHRLTPILPPTFTMTPWEDFKKWFNSAFWRVFRNRTFPIYVPKTVADREATMQAPYAITPALVYILGEIDRIGRKWDLV